MASGRLIVLSEDQLKLARSLFSNGFSPTRVASECGVSLPIIDRYRRAGENGFPAVRQSQAIAERRKYGVNGI